MDTTTGEQMDESVKKEVRSHQARRNPEGPQSPATQLLYLLEPLREIEPVGAE